MHNCYTNPSTGSSAGVAEDVFGTSAVSKGKLTASSEPTFAASATAYGVEGLGLTVQMGLGSKVRGAVLRALYNKEGNNYLQGPYRDLVLIKSDPHNK